jgi:cytochrome c-type biogenesis protein CcmH
VPLFWFFIGMLTTVAIACVLLPWLRTIPRLDALPALPWQAPLVGVLMIAAALLLYRSLGRPDLVQSAPTATATAGMPIGNGTVSSAAAGAGAAAAGSMQSAVASLESRLAQGGGSAGDWELLAKSYDFIGRPDAAAAARRHDLPDRAPGGVDAGVAQAGQMDADTWADSADAAGSAAGGKLAGAPKTYIQAASGAAVVSGEVLLSDSLLKKVPAGGTLFIVAKSVDSPGAPVAAYRGGVGQWPVKFTLDDSNAMLPGRNLSRAGRVTVEARISESGQALPASGDLRGSSGVINPTQRAPLKIVIDDVVK